MKVHVWAPQFAGFAGGIGAFSRELARGLAELGHEVQLAGKTDVDRSWNGLPLWGAGKVPARARTTAFAAGVFALCRRHRPDLVISTHVNFGPAARVVKRAFGTRVALVAHGVDINEGLSKTRRSAICAADRMIAVSSWTRSRLAALPCINADDVAVLPNTVDCARFSVRPIPEYLIDRYAIMPGERVVLTVARLESDEGYKGCDRLIRALPFIRAQCGAIRYVIAGKGNERAALEQLAHELGVNELVTFAGFVPEDELADHFRLADVYAMPSTGEGFGIVFLEAMACGTPVLGGNADGSVDALAGGELGLLVQPDDVKAIAEGIVGLLRRKGPPLWFDRDLLHDAVSLRFGHEAFRAALQRAIA